VRYLEKMEKYPDVGPKFKPLVIESTGGWHNYSMDYLKSIAGRIASRSNKSNISVWWRGPNNSKAEVTAARAEVTEATATRDRALANWRITSEVLQAAEANF
jgi:hypothetical protein